MIRSTPHTVISRRLPQAMVAVGQLVLTSIGLVDLHVGRCAVSSPCACRCGRCINYRYRTVYHNYTLICLYAHGKHWV